MLVKNCRSYSFKIALLTVKYIFLKILRRTVITILQCYIYIVLLYKIIYVCVQIYKLFCALVSMNDQVMRSWLQGRMYLHNHGCNGSRPHDDCLHQPCLSHFIGHTNCCLGHWFIYALPHSCRQYMISMIHELNTYIVGWLMQFMLHKCALTKHILIMVSGNHPCMLLF